MRNTHSFFVQFFLRMNKMKNNHAPVYARIAVDGVRKEMALKQTIAPCDWDSENGKPCGNRPDLKMLGDLLVQIQADLMQCYQELRL